VNPDHFAGYLASIFPLALAGLIFGGFPAHSKSGLATRVMYGFAAFLIFTAVALSQSRAGWIGLTVGTLLTIGLVSFQSRDGRESTGGTAKQNPVALSLAILASMVVLALMFTGQHGREQTAGRFSETVIRGGLDFHARYSLWAAAPQIIREFPILGAGMGAWPEVFFRFQPPHPVGFINYAAHNDYLEMMVSVGLIGTVLAGWLIFTIGARLKKALHAVPAHLLPAMAAIISGLIVMSIIELVDFDLHVPANLILVTILAALRNRRNRRTHRRLVCGNGFTCRSRRRLCLRSSRCCKGAHRIPTTSGKPRRRPTRGVYCTAIRLIRRFTNRSCADLDRR
jgi:O-antigen ligase